MTNGEKLQKIFPNMRIDVFTSYVEVMGENYEFNNLYPIKWWNAEYKEPTTKNDLGVDCIDRKATLDAIIKRLGIKNETYLLEAERVIYQQILAMPSVTPQLSSGLDKNSQKLEKDFGESDCISRAAARSLICEIDIKYHTFGISRKAFKDLYNGMDELPSVTPIRPNGHWTEEFNDLEGEVRFTCSSCGKYQLFGTDFCYHCGSDNREVVEE